MKSLTWNLLRAMVGTVGLMVLILSADSAEPPGTPLSAKDLAASLSAVQEGSSYVRLRLQVKQPAGTAQITLQLQIRQRRTRATTDLVYQILWPKERKGEAVLLHQADGSPPSGSIYLPPDKPRPLNTSQMSDALFGSDLSYWDLIENFFQWENQKIVGNEVLHNVNCVILESRPGKSELSVYGSVRSWIDTLRLVPLRVEKYLPSGQIGRRIDTTRVAADDRGRPIPADLTVRGARENSVTDLDGSRIRHDVVFTDRDFTPEGLTDVLAPPSATE